MLTLNQFYALDCDAVEESGALPLASSSISAGFPSPAEDHMEDRLNLNQYLVKNPIATFFFRVAGESMIDAGLHDGDLLIVDRSLIAQSHSIVIAVLNGDMVVKYFIHQKDDVILRPANAKYQDYIVTDKDDFSIWGVVTYVIHALRR